jgi:hypothetical protein
MDKVFTLVQKKISGRTFVKKKIFFRNTFEKMKTQFRALSSQTVFSHKFLLLFRCTIGMVHNGIRFGD